MMSSHVVSPDDIHLPTGCIGAEGTLCNRPNFFTTLTNVSVKIGLVIKDVLACIACVCRLESSLYHLSHF